MITMCNESTQPPLSFWNRFMPAQARRGLLMMSICALIVLLGTPSPAAAQTAATPPASAQPAVEQSSDVEKSGTRWEQHFAAQVNTLLEAPQSNLRTQGLQLVERFSSRDGLAHKLNVLRPQLYVIFFDTRNSDEERIQALAALRAIGPEETREALATWIEQEESPRVQQALEQQSAQRG